MNQVRSNERRPVLKEKKCLAVVVIIASLISETDLNREADYRMDGNSPFKVRPLWSEIAKIARGPTMSRLIC